MFRAPHKNAHQVINVRARRAGDQQIAHRLQIRIGVVLRQRCRRVQPQRTPTRQRLPVHQATGGVGRAVRAVGGLVDGQTLARGRALGLDAAAALAQNDAYTYLQAVGDLLVTGPTRTNVNDVMCVFVWGAE